MTDHARNNSQSYTTYRVDPSETAVYRYSFFPRTTIVIDWNNLEQEIISSKTLKSFKTQISCCPQNIGCSPLVRWHYTQDWVLSAYCTYTSYSAHQDQDPRVRRLRVVELEEAYWVYVETYNFLIPTILPLKGNILSQRYFLCKVPLCMFWKVIHSVFFRPEKVTAETGTPKAPGQGTAVKSQGSDVVTAPQIASNRRSFPSFLKRVETFSISFLIHTCILSHTVTHVCSDVDSRGIPMNSTGSKK